MKSVKKTPVLILTVLMVFTMLPLSALAAEEPITADVEDYAELIEALDDENVDWINITDDFTLEDHVTINREVVIASDGDNVITMDEDADELEAHSFIVEDGGSLTVEGSLILEGVGPAGIASVLGIIHVNTGGSFTLAGGTIEAVGGSGLTGLGIYVNGGDAVISGGFIDAIIGVLVNAGTLAVSGAAEIYASEDGILVIGGNIDISGGLIDDADCGVYVDGGTVTIRGDVEINASEIGVKVGGSNITISGGSISATDFEGCGVYVDGGAATINGNVEISAYDTGVYVSGGGTAGIGGDACIEAYYGVCVESGTADIGGKAFITADYGVCVEGGTANIGGEAEITADEIGVDVEDQYEDEDKEIFAEHGLANISGDAVIESSDMGVRLTDGGNANISGGKIKSYDHGVYVGTNCRAVISGDADIESDSDGESNGVYVEGEAEISGGRILGYTGVCVEGGTAAISGGTIETNAGEGAGSGIFIYDGIVDITAGAALSVTGFVYGWVWDEELEDYDNKVFLTELPEPVSATVGATKTVALAGVDEDVSFEIAPTPPAALGAAIDANTVTLTPTAAGSYSLVLTAAVEDGTLNLTIPVTVSAAPTYKGSGGGGSSPTTPDFTAGVTAGDNGGSPLPITVDTNNGTATVDTGSARLAQGGTTITIPPIPGVDTYKVNIPILELSTAGEQGSLTLKTDNGSITIPSNMLSGVTDASGSKAEISIGQGDKSNLPDDVKAAIGDKPLIRLTLSIDGKQTDWNNSEAPVTVSIPYTPTGAELANPESIVVWYIDGSGNVVTIPNGHYDAATGTVTFSTTHFSDYAVAYNKVNFTDVAVGAWYSNAVNFIVAREITSGTGDGSTYSPEAKLTRGQFIVLLMRAYGIAPDAAGASNFSDAGNTYYTGYLGAAKRLGIASGVGDNKYAPTAQITRQEMFTLLYKALKVIGQLPEGDSGKTFADFSDASSIAPWGQEAMRLLIKTGTVGGSKGKLTPTNTTTRAEMAQVLYNLLSFRSST